MLGGGSYPSAEMQSVYFTAPNDWASKSSKVDVQIDKHYVLKKNDCNEIVMIRVKYLKKINQTKPHPSMILILLISQSLKNVLYH